MAQSEHYDRADPCPLLGVKRTSTGESLVQLSATHSVSGEAVHRIKGPRGRFFYLKQKPVRQVRRPERRFGHQGAAVAVAREVEVQGDVVP